MKKHIALLAVALLAGAGALQAQNSILIGNFEDGSFDGWVPQETATFAPTSFGATVGSGALQIHNTENWRKVARYNAMSLRSDIAQPGTTITLDLSLRNEESMNIPNWWMQTHMIINSDGGGWYDLGMIEKPVTWGPSTYNLSWTIPSDKGALFGTSTIYAELFIINNCGVLGATYSVDNIRINTVPEPSSLALLSLGLAGFAMIRRRAA